LKAGGTTAKTFTTEFAESAERGKIRAASRLNLRVMHSTVKAAVHRRTPYGSWRMIELWSSLGCEAKFKGTQAGVSVPQKSKALR
jgi:hypothetical protein